MTDTTPTAGGGGTGNWYPMPRCSYDDVCRICLAPLAPFHSRYAKWCGQAPCPTAGGLALEWQKAGRRE